MDSKIKVYHHESYNQLLDSYKTSNFADKARLEHMTEALFEGYDKQQLTQNTAANIQKIDQVRKDIALVDKQWQREKERGMVESFCLATALDYNIDAVADERPETEFNEDNPDLRGESKHKYKKTIIAEPKLYLFETLLNEELCNTELDDYIIHKYGDWACTNIYHNPFVQLVALITQVKVTAPKLETSEDFDYEEHVYCSPALLANYLQVLEIILNELDQLKEELELERGFALYCKVIPHAVFGELAMYDQQFEYEKNYYESTGYLGANDYDSSSDCSLEEESDPIREIPEEDIDEDARYATVSEVEDNECLASRTIANIWLQADDVPLLDQVDDEDVVLEDQHVGKSSQIDVRYLDSPSIHIDIVRMIRRAGVMSLTEHLIGEGLFCLREYIHAVLKKIILNGIEQKSGIVTDYDIHEVISTLKYGSLRMPGGILTYSTYYSEPSQDKYDSSDSEDEDDSVTLEDKDSDDDMSEDTADAEASNGDAEVDQDYSLVVTMVPVPESQFQADLMLEQNLRIDDANTVIGSSQFKCKFKSQCVIGLKCIMELRCPGIAELFENGDTFSLPSKIDITSFFAYLKYIYTGDTEHVSGMEDSASILTVLDTLYPLTEVPIDDLLTSGSHSDLTITIQNVDFKVHKAILSARSEFLRGLLNTNMEEASQTSIDMSENIPTTQPMQLALTYMYCDHVQLTLQDAIDLIPVADYLMLPRLSALCQLY
jgi:hypothetical protein